MNKTGIRDNIKSFILNMKIPQSAMGGILYLSFCFAYFAESRISLATSLTLYSDSYYQEMMSIMGNGVVAFLIGGIFPYIIFSMVTRMVLRRLRLYGVDYIKSGYVFNVFLSLGLIVSGLVSIVTMFFPVLTALYTVIIKFIILLGAVALYTLFMSKNCLPPYLIPKFVFQCLMTFLVAYTAVAVINIFSMAVN